MVKVYPESFQLQAPCQLLPIPELTHQHLDRKISRLNLLLHLWHTHCPCGSNSCAALYKSLMWTSGYTRHTQTQGGGWDGTRLCAWLIRSRHFTPCHKTCRWSWPSWGCFTPPCSGVVTTLCTSMCFLNPQLSLKLFRQISLLKSASSLALLLFTPLAQEGICLARFCLP